MTCSELDAVACPIRLRRRLVERAEFGQALALALALADAHAHADRLVNQSAFTCPSSDTAASAARSSGLGEGVARRVPAAGSRGALTADGLLAVTYEAQALSSSRATLAAREQALGASLVNEYAFPHAGVTTRILSVTPSQAAAVEAALRSQSGVRSVGPVGLRYPTTVTSPYYPNDPYFNGFTAAQNTSEGNSAPATYHVAPYWKARTCQASGACTPCSSSTPSATASAATRRSPMPTPSARRA